MYSGIVSVASIFFTLQEQEHFYLFIVLQQQKQKFEKNIKKSITKK